MQALVVVNPFADYQRGAQITDAETIAAVLETQNAANVVAVDLPDAPPIAAKAV